MSKYRPVGEEISIESMRYMRDEEHLTNKEIAERLGLSYTTVYNYLGKMPPELVSKVVEEAGVYRAATAASRVTDTVKMATKDGFISSTIDRDFVWNVQTPQVFEVKLYAASAYSA